MWILPDWKKTKKLKEKKLFEFFISFEFENTLRHLKVLLAFEFVFVILFENSPRALQNTADISIVFVFWNTNRHSKVFLAFYNPKHLNNAGISYHISFLSDFLLLSNLSCFHWFPPNFFSLENRAMNEWKGERRPFIRFILQPRQQFCKDFFLLQNSVNFTSMAFLMNNNPAKF